MVVVEYVKLGREYGCFVETLGLLVGAVVASL